MSPGSDRDPSGTSRRRWRRGVRRRRTPDLDGTLEQDILDVLHQAGLPPAGADLGEADRRRTDTVAAAALSRITDSPRNPTSGVETRHPLSVDGFRRRRHSSRRRTLPPPLTVGALATALAVVLLFTVIAWSSNQVPGQPTTAPTTTTPTTPTSAPATSAPGPTPAMARFSLVSHQSPALGGDPATAELDRLARAAARQPASGSGPIQHVKLDSWYLEQGARASAALVPTITDRYFLSDGDLRNIESRGTPLDQFGRVASPDAGSSPTADETYPGPEPGPDYPSTLPTDPARLVRRLVPDPRECPALAQCLTTQLLDLTYTWVLPPALTSALWRAMAEQDGVRFLGSTVDRLNRPAVAFSVTTGRGNLRLVLYVDPDTGRLLGSEEVLLSQDENDASALQLELPAVISFSALVLSERVSADELP